MNTSRPRTNKRRPAAPVAQQQAPPDILDATTLAQLAAQPRFTKYDPLAAAKAALEMWQECREVLGAFHRRCREAAEEQQRVPIPQPQQWPAPLQDFFRLIVKAKDKSENLPRFQRFLLWRINEIRRTVENDPGNEDPKYSPKPPLVEGNEETTKTVRDSLAVYQHIDKELWSPLAEDYMGWWKAETAAAKGFAGSVRAHMNDTPAQLARLTPKLAEAVRNAQARKKAVADGKLRAAFAAHPEAPPHKSKKSLSTVERLEKLHTAQERELAKPSLKRSQPAS